jgi:predicted hydrolase (HD superfamily)
VPRRSRDKFGEHHGKHKYISANFNRDWEAKKDKIEVKSHVELEQGEEVEIKTDIVDVVGEIADYTSEDNKKTRRAKIMKAHPDRGGTDEELKKVLDEEG